jgi:HSP20 family protein
VTKLAELAEKGEELKKTGELDFSKLGGGKGVKGVYGFSVKFGGQGGHGGLTVEPFGNIKQDSVGQTVVEEVHEPLVDVFEESDHVLVVVELPGVEEKNVTLELNGDILTIHGERGEKKYHKEVLLPCQGSANKMTRVLRNGILEVRLAK